MTAKSMCASQSVCGVPAPRTELNPYLKLIIGIALILGFIFGIGSLAQFIPGARHMARVIDERNLRATAIFYTDFEEPAEGSERIRDSLDYRPGSKP
ncbi:MAG: hypothetical protein ABIJ52_13980 [Pseudomonadota bacterium]